MQQYVSALKANNLDPLKLAFLKHQPPIVLSNNAQIQTVEVGDIWQIVDGAQSYTLWTDPDENGKTELYAAPSLTKTQAVFHQNNMTLRWQASVAVDTAGQQWLLDNDSENPQNFSTGYVKFHREVERQRAGRVPGIAPFQHYRTIGWWARPCVSRGWGTTSSYRWTRRPAT